MPLLVPTLTSIPQSMSELEHRIPRIERHIFHGTFNRGRTPRQFERQLALWLRNTKDTVAKSVRRAAIATEKSTRTLGDIRSSSGTNESNVNSAIDEVSKKQRLA
jgi:hypothetical protein